MDSALFTRALEGILAVSRKKAGKETKGG